MTSGAAQARPDRPAAAPPADGGRAAYRRIAVDSRHTDEEASLSVGTLRLSRSACSPEVLVNSGDDGAGTEILVLREGRGEGLFGPERVSLRSGDVIVLSLQRRFALGLSSGRQLSVTLPAASAPVHVRSQDLHGLVLDGRGGLGTLVAGLAEALWDIADASAHDEAAAAARCLLEILTVASGERGSRPTIDEDELIIERVQSIVDRLVAAPDLTPTRLAQEAAVSRASLYRAFVPFGGVSAYVRDYRLRRSRALLELTGARVAIIGFAHGFRSEAQFSRAFKARFGQPPSRLRPRAPSAGRMAPDEAADRHASLEMRGVKEVLAQVLCGAQP